MTTPSKQRIQQSFERAATTYNDAAELQREICRDMAKVLPSLTENRCTGLPCRTILDAGCGTGYAQALLCQQFPHARSLAVDLSVGMLKQASHIPERFAGDLERLPIATGSIDIFWSSLAVQWCNLPLVFQEAKRVLAPGGYMLISTLGPQTFIELRHAFHAVDQHQHTLDFHSQNRVQEFALHSDFVVQTIHSIQKTVFYPDLKTLLHAVKAVGANTIGEGRRKGLMTASAFTKASLAYEKHRTPAGLPLRYEILQLVAFA